MAWPPYYMFLHPGLYDGVPDLDKLTVQDLVDHRVIAPVHVSQVEQEMARASSSAWKSVCDLGLKPATLTGPELWAQMARLRREHPELDEQELVSHGMRLFRGAVTPARIEEALREKSLGSRA